MGIRYIFGNLRTGEVLDEIALQGVTMTAKLNSWGTFGGTFQLDQSGRSNIDLIGATVPGMCFVCAEVDDLPAWFGIVWTGVYQAQSKTLTISGRTLEAYPEKVRFDEPLTYEQVEQRNIFIDLWERMQSDPNRNLDVILPSDYPNAVLRDLTIEPNEEKDMAQVLDSVADGDDGFDWSIEVTKSGSSYIKTMRIGYPILESNTGAAPLNFDYPGQITNYYETVSMSKAATHSKLLGAGDGATMLTSSTVHDDLMASGRWLRFDERYSYKDVNKQANLDSLAATVKKQTKPPMTTIKVFLKGDLDPKFTTYPLATNAVLSFNDAKHPDGVQYETRIVAWSYKPSSDQSVSEAELIFEGDELNNG